MQSCEKLPALITYIEIPKYVVMSNHYHAIIRIHDFDDERRGGSRPAPTTDKPMTEWEQPKIKPLGQLIGAFKTISAKQINLAQSTPGAHVWQRNYYDHIIRNDGEFRKTGDYIDTNPITWADDQLSPI